MAVARRSVVTVTSVTTPRRHWQLHNPNASGAPLEFLVVGSRADAWKVAVPARPNGSVGWVAEADVEVQVDDYALRVSLHKRTLVVFRNGVEIHRYPVGIGRPSAPTPTGHFFLTELLQAADASGPYGPYAYGTSAFSDVYSEFEGGPGQIGVHGTNDPTSIGRNVSHGCLRLRLEDITAMAHQVPAGTPLTISD